MARIRYLKPEFFLNKRLADLGPHAMLLFQGLWLLADREGRLLDVPFSIHGQVFPYYKKVDCDLILRELSTSGFIDRYSDGERNYIQVMNFSKHQKPHQKERPSIFPSPEQCKGLCPAPEKVVLSTGKEMIGMGIGNGNENRDGELAKADPRPPVEKWLDWRKSESGQKKLHELLSLTRSDADTRPRLTETEFREALKDKEQWLRDHEKDPKIRNRVNWSQSASNWMKIAYERKKERESRATGFTTNLSDRAYDETKRRTGSGGGFTKIGDMVND